MEAPDQNRAFSFLRVNRRPPKPRRTGVTEIRGPYYTPMGKRYLQDVLETMGRYVDALKFAGGSFSLMPRAVVRELIETCHAHDGRFRAPGRGGAEGRHEGEAGGRHPVRRRRRQRGGGAGRGRDPRSGV